MFSSALQRAIARGMQPNGNLNDELGKLNDYPIRSRKDAKAICDALRRLPLKASDENGFSSPLHALAALFQDVDGGDCPAFEVLYREGLPELMRIFDARIEDPEADDDADLLMVLKILALYGSREGADTIVKAARRPLQPRGYLWHVILSAFSENHPQRDYLFAALSDPLPGHSIAGALLDSANALAIDGHLSAHPFNSPIGWQQLQSWLDDSEPEHFCYAQSATAALPFMSASARDRLLALAMDHPAANVQMQAAWAAGKLGRESGLKILARYCLDINHSDVAQRFLAEFDRQDLIPPEAKDPSFRAQADFAQWLAHPNELGKPPDELKIVDHRLVAWPPERELKPFWLIRYLLRDRTGLKEDNVDCGLVGSMTWCFFTYHMHERPPEDAYAIHCYWEMTNAGLIAEAQVTDPSEYVGMLNQWQGPPLQEPRVIRAAELSPALKPPARLVALASARLDGKDGHVVLDGPRSTWYPNDEQPQETYEAVLLSIHVGRHLLGFHDQPDRKRWLIVDRPRREPQEIIAAYEKLIAEARDAEPKRQKELLGSWSVLSSHFDSYCEAVATVNGASKPETVIQVYEGFLKLAKNAHPSIGDEVYGTLSVVGDHFDDCVGALVSCGQLAKVSELITLFAPQWDNNLGYGRIGAAAFKVGQRDTAERYFLRLRDGHANYWRSEEMSALAEIWWDRGELERAGDLLIDCMRKLVVEVQESKYNSDRQTFAEEFKHHRSTYLRLFPQGEQQLLQLGLPVSPL